MSFNLRNIREPSNDPQAKYVNAIAKRLSQFLTKDQLDQLGDKEDIYSDGRDIETVIRYNNGLLSYKKFEQDVSYYPPFEPDGEIVTCWIKGRNLGNTTGDFSGFGNSATIYGDPVLVDGYPFDYGVNTHDIKSFGTRFNRPTSDYQNEEYMKIPDADGLKITGLTTGMSFMVRFRPKSFEEQGGADPSIFSKVDDNTPNNGYRLRINDDGRLILILKIGGVETKKITQNSISTDDVYTVFVTLNSDASDVHIYTKREPDGEEIDQTLFDNGSSAGWQSDLTNHDLSIFRKGEGSDDGHVYGDFFDFLVYRRELTLQEVTNYFTNKWTIEDYPFGQVMVTNHYSVSGTEPEIETEASYTTDSYTDESYTTIPDVITPEEPSFSSSFSEDSFNV